MGAVLAACEHAGRSGKEFLTALAVAYQVETVLTASAPSMERGFDLTTLPGFGLIGPRVDLRQMRPEMARVTGSGNCLRDNKRSI
jgi:hypothetical protein